MSKINFSLIKDIIISLLIVICIILICSVFFYDDISLTTVIPQSQEYELSEEMQEELEETYSENATEVITTYEIDSEDLKKYEKTKQYDKGKSNPFAEQSVYINNVNTVVNGTEDQTTSSNSTGFYEDDGTK